MTTPHRLAAVALLVAGAFAQSKTADERPAPLAFCDAWLIEQLDRDPLAARAAYLRAEREDPTSEGRTLALACRIELDRVLGRRDEVERGIGSLRERLPTEWRPYNTELELPRAELERTANAKEGDPAREAALTQLRDACAELFANPGRRAELSRWVEGSVARARAFGPGAPEREAGPARSAPGSISVWRERGLRLLLANRVAEAERLAARIRGAAGTPGRADELPQAILPDAVLAGILAREDLAAAERTALEELGRKFADWSREGRDEELARAIAALPYEFTP
ncbi:MAG: hypothetical protein IT457_13700 [Planctomycetes bacterium]|nr:hypothetical protein [Planctomycetota bacterium]